MEDDALDFLDDDDDVDLGFFLAEGDFVFDAVDFFFGAAFFLVGEDAAFFLTALGFLGDHNADKGTSSSLSSLPYAPSSSSSSIAGPDGRDKGMKMVMMVLVIKMTMMVIRITPRFVMTSLVIHCTLSR